MTRHTLFMPLWLGARFFPVWAFSPSSSASLNKTASPGSGLGFTLTWSVSHSRLPRVLWASTQRLGFMSLGQMPSVRVSEAAGPEPREAPSSNNSKAAPCPQRDRRQQPRRHMLSLQRSETSPEEQPGWALGLLLPQGHGHPALPTPVGLCGLLRLLKAASTPSLWSHGLQASDEELPLPGNGRAHQGQAWIYVWAMQVWSGLT